MSANSADLFRKGARKWVGQIGAAGVADDTVTTIPLASATGLPTDTAVDLVIDRVSSDGTKTPSLEETVTVVISGSNGTNAIRGVEGTAQAHLAGAVVEVLLTNSMLDDLMDGILVEHDQAGALKNRVGADAGLLTGTAGTSGYLAKWNADGDLVDGPQLAGADAKVLTGTPGTSGYTAYWNADGDLVDGADPASYGSTDGWLDATSETWTYASATSFTIAGVDKTAQYTKGTRIKLTQTTVKYFVVTSSSFSTDTTVNITAGSSYTFANAAVTNNYYSYAANPQGYPNSFSWSPSFTGFSSDPTGTHIFSVTGGTCTVLVNETGDGTSNATTFYISAPIAPNATSQRCPLSFYRDSGSAGTEMGIVQISSANGLELYKTVGLTGWTNSGAKRAIFNITYLM